MKLIFDNTKFGSLNVSSRIIRNGLWESQNDSSKNLTQKVFDRYEKLAKNNVGVITTELISMYSHDRFSDYTHYINSPLFIKDFKEVTDIAHENNTPILAQIGFVNCNVNGKQMMEVNDLTIEDIRTIQADYVVAAKKIMFAGFDGIELCIGNNFYLSRVMDPFENTRSDDYGGSTFNRVRMVLEIIKLIKKTTDLHIHCKVIYIRTRMILWKYVKYWLKTVQTVCRLQNSSLHNTLEKVKQIRTCWLNLLIGLQKMFLCQLF